MKSENFKKCEIPTLNLISGGKKDTTCELSSTGTCYKDIKYDCDEKNETSGTLACQYGGLDKTSDPCKG